MFVKPRQFFLLGWINLTRVLTVQFLHCNHSFRTQQPEYCSRPFVLPYVFKVSYETCRTVYVHVHVGR